MVIKYIHAIFPIFTVFSLDNAQSWEEVYRLRDMIIEAKNDPEVPIVIVANKSDLEVDRSLPHESLEATAIFDWENGYVECSAKERKNINKIFRELLNQTKSRFKISISSFVKTCNCTIKYRGRCKLRKFTLNDIFGEYFHDCFLENVKVNTVSHNDSPRGNLLLRKPGRR